MRFPQLARLSKFRLTADLHRCPAHPKVADRPLAAGHQRQLSGRLADHAEFIQLNHAWNAEPNAPDPHVSVVGSDVLVTFYVNAFRFPQFAEDTTATLRFKNCERYRLGPTNDEGWDMGKCRFSQLAPAWGEFYAISGEAELLLSPVDWIVVSTAIRAGVGKHFLFYFRDATFECVSDGWEVELPSVPS